MSDHELRDATDESAKIPHSDHLLAEAIAEIEAAFENQKQPDFDSLDRRFPEHKQELREVALTIKALHDCAGGNDEARLIDGQPLGDFKLLREIGRGGMGIVYEAEQLSLGRRVAVKVLPYAALLDKRQLERFRNEARAAALLNHRNIVHVLSVGFERGLHYYAMELVEGCSLAKIIAASEATSSDATRDTVPVASLSTLRHNDRQAFFKCVANLGEQVAAGLSTSHEIGIVHRDIKPSNLLLDQDGQLMIADFGLARIQSDPGMTATGELIGTLRYMSPEQIENPATLDHRSDIYSLGVTLYELVSGQPFLVGSSKGQLVNEIVNGKPKSLKSLVRDVPTDLETVIHKAISNNVDKRYENADELRDDLNRFVHGRPVLARRVGAAEVAYKWCRRNCAAAALIAMTFLVVLSLAIGGPIVAWHQTSVASRQRHAAYDADMALANGHIEYGEINQAVEILRKYLPAKDGGPNDYRSFEWYEMLYRCRRRLEAKEIQLSSWGYSVVVSPAGDLATSSFGEAPVVYDSVTFERKWPAPKTEGLAKDVFDLAFSSDGQFLFSVGSDGKVRIWSTSEQRVVHTESIPVVLSSVAANAHGLLAVGVRPSERFPNYDRSSVHLFQIIRGSDGDVTLRPSGSLDGVVGAGRDISFSPGGRFLACGCEDSTLRVWNVETKELVAAFDDFYGPVMATAFSPNGKLVCGAGGIDNSTSSLGETIVFDLDTQERVATYTHSAVVRSVVFPSDTRLLTAGVDRRISHWDLEKQRCIGSIIAHADTVREIALLPDRLRFVSVGDDNVIRIWELDSLDPPSILSNPIDPHSNFDLSFSPDGGELAAAGHDGFVRLWDTRSGTLKNTLERHKTSVTGVAYSLDGNRIASVAAPFQDQNNTPAELKIWDRATRTAETYQIPDLGYARSVAYAPSGRHVAISGKYLALWNVEEQRIERKHERSAWSLRVVFSRDGSLIATCGQLLEYPSLKMVCDLPATVRTFGVAIHPENSCIAVSEPGSNDILLLSLAGSQITRFSGHHDVILHLDFSSDGKRLASASQAGLVILWNLETGNEVLRYRDHRFLAWSGLFSLGDRMLASCQGGLLRAPTINLRRTLTPIEARQLLERGR